MDNRLNKKTDNYMKKFKDSIVEKAEELNLIDKDDATKSSSMNTLLSYIYDYERLIFSSEDLKKRKRVKNIVPKFNRCCAKRANGEQCTRKRKDDNEYCGTHIKGVPHGFITGTSENIVTDTKQKVEVWTEDIQGIIYYIDNMNNVYSTEDIVKNKINPNIIAKYVKDNDVYSIPEFDF